LSHAGGLVPKQINARSGSLWASLGKLFIGQPAVSASLAKLRTIFADPLFVKVGRYRADATGVGRIRFDQ